MVLKKFLLGLVLLLGFGLSYHLFAPSWLQVSQFYPRVETVLGETISPTDPDARVVIDYFYSPTCQFCAKAERFLDLLEKRYPQITVNRYLSFDPKNRAILEELAQKTNAQKHIGLVPLMFIGDRYFLGFDSPDNIGRQIENQVRKMLGQNVPIEQTADLAEKVTLPLIGEINLKDYSLPALAVVMGFLDGFNICSLGAIVLLLSLIIGFKSRKKILLFGGLFILVTTMTYGLLMVMWFNVFNLLGDYLRNFQMLVGVMAVLGGIFFLQQFLKFRKHGPVCDLGKGKMASKLIQGLRESFNNPKSILLTIGAVLTFAFLVTVIEFPCSAAVPVVFTGVLAEAQLAGFAYLFYIVLFLLFYMLDEIIVFLIAVFTMRLWLVSSKFVTYTTLLQGIVLLTLGAYYLFGL